VKIPLTVRRELRGKIPSVVRESRTLIPVLQKRIRMLGLFLVRECGGTLSQAENEVKKKVWSESMRISSSEWLVGVELAEGEIPVKSPRRSSGELSDQLILRCLKLQR